MNRKIVFLNLFLIFVLCIYNFSVYALSQDTRKDSKSSTGKQEGQKGEAKEGKGKEQGDSVNIDEILNEAVILYNEGKFEEAAELFKKAAEISKSPNVIYNIAKCYNKAYKYAEAHKYYQEYLLTGDKVKADEALEAMRIIEEMLLILKITSIPEGANVEVDGKPVENQKTPVIIEVTAGKHVVTVRMDGYEEEQKEIEIPYGGEGKVDFELKRKFHEPEVKAEILKTEKGTKEEKAKKAKRVAGSIGLSMGATVSTSDVIGSFIDGSLYGLFNFRGGIVGIELDNLFFNDSYIISAYPAGGYRLEIKQLKKLFVDFIAGFGAVYFNSFDDGGDGKGKLLVEAGSHWDLVAHVEIKVCLNVGPVYVSINPVHANVFTGTGNIKPAPLVQFAILAGVGYSFLK